jgi:hypothetical protein
MRTGCATGSFERALEGIKLGASEERVSPCPWFTALLDGTLLSN